jgi:DNA-binding HxlR family transcriptional regulator
MPGKWHVKILQALAVAAPLSSGALQARCQAATFYERAALRRALRRLVAQGLVTRQGRGRYGRVEDWAARLRARHPHAKAWGRGA